MRLLLTMAASSAFLLAQTPARDVPARITTGTASIVGAVATDDADARPVRMAMVQLKGAALEKSEMLTTDESGRFLFTDLPAGRYTVEVSKPGFVTREFGATRPGGSGVPVVVAAGERGVANMKLLHGAAITGTILDANGEPASGVRVSLMQYVTSQRGDRTLTAAQAMSGWRWTRTTDDRGTYRFYGLPPGEFYVAALPRDGSGRQLTSAEFDWVWSLLQMGGAGRAVAPPPPGPSASFSPVLFPGTVDVAGATGIAVASGEERTGIDFAIQYAQTATVSGVVVDPDGVPPRLTQISMLRPSISIFLGSSVSIRPGPDGRFSVSGVVPGQYVLAARGSSQAPAAGSSASTSGGATSATLPLWAVMDVAVDGRDITNLDVKLQSGVAVSGRLVFDGKSATPPADLTRALVSVSQVQSGQTVSVSPPDGQVSAGGTFTVKGLAPGRYRLTASAPAGAGGSAVWTLRSAVVGGADSLDYPFEVRSGENIADAVVTFTDQPTEITGTLLDTAGRPAPELFIVVFSTDRAFWTTSSRRVRSTRPGSTGAYRIAGLPPGQYYMCALNDFESNLLYTTPFLESLVGASFTIALTEGQKRVQDLRVR